MVQDIAFIDFTLHQAPATVEELSGSKGALLDAIPLNPPIEDALIMRQQLMTKRAAAKAKKASKQASKALAAAVPEAVASAMAAVEHGSGAAAARTAVPEPAHAQKRSAAAMAEPQLHADQVGLLSCQPQHGQAAVWPCSQQHACQVSGSCRFMLRHHHV